MRLGRTHRWLMARPHAHRGLHGRDGRGRTDPVHSLAAFREAVKAGCGIECDARRTEDGVLHVFHDASLEGLNGERVAALPLRNGSAFPSQRRHIARGLVLDSRSHPIFAAPRRHALAIARARPHFLARDIRAQIFRPCRPAIATLVWTVRSGAGRVRAPTGDGHVVLQWRRCPPVQG